MNVVSENNRQRKILKFFFPAHGFDRFFVVQIFFGVPIGPCANDK